MIKDEKKVDGRGAALATSKINAQKLRVIRVKAIITKMKNVTFDNITALSEYVAREFSLEHDEVISPTTLRRNNNYRRMLDRLLEKGEESGSELIEMTEDLLIANSENFQLNKELNTANVTISGLLSKRSADKTKSLEDRTHGQVAEFDDTPCIALMKFIDHVGDFKIKRSGVFDLGHLNEPLIISPEDYPEFFAWYFKDNS